MGELKAFSEIKIDGTDNQFDLQDLLGSDVARVECRVELINAKPVVVVSSVVFIDGQSVLFDGSEPTISGRGDAELSERQLLSIRDEVLAIYESRKAR